MPRPTLEPRRAIVRGELSGGLHNGAYTRPERPPAPSRSLPGHPTGSRRGRTGLLRHRTERARRERAAARAGRVPEWHQSRTSPTETGLRMVAEVLDGP